MASLTMSHSPVPMTIINHQKKTEMEIKMGPDPKNPWEKWEPAAGVG